MFNINLILVLLCFFVILYTIFSWMSIPYNVHVEMTKKYTEKYKKVNFKEFLEAFQKYENNPMIEYDNDYQSIFLWKKEVISEYPYISIPKYPLVYIHAGICKIDNIGLIFDPLSWRKFRKWKDNLFKIKETTEVVGGEKSISTTDRK